MPAKQNRITVKEAETETCAWVVTESSWRLVTAALTKSELCHESGEGEKYPSGYTLTASHTSDRPCRHFSNQTTNLWLTNCHCGSKQRHSDPERGRYTQTENVARASNKTHDSEIAHDDVVTYAEYIFTENDAVTETSAPDISTFNDCRQSCCSLVCCAERPSRKMPPHLSASPDSAGEIQEEGGGYERVMREQSLLGDRY